MSLDAFNVLARWPDDGPHSVDELAEKFGDDEADLDRFVRELEKADALTRAGVEPTRYDLTALGGILASDPYGGRFIGTDQEVDR